MADVISVNDLRAGMTFMYEGHVNIVLEQSFAKVAMAKSKITVKAKNLITGSIREITFTGGDKVDGAYVQKETMQYLYNDGSMATFMNNNTFEQIEIPMEKLQHEMDFIPEGSNISVTVFEGRVLGVDVPRNVKLKVTYAEDAVQGNSVTSSSKKATLETGITIDVPQFIKTGEEIIISTVDKKYVSKA